MIRPVQSTLVSLVLVAALSSCHAQPKAGHGEVSGQILPGSVSDAMLPYDAVKSKAPLAPPEATGVPGGGSADNAAADSADTTATADSAPPETTASPAPAAPVPGN